MTQRLLGAWFVLVAAFLLFPLLFLPPLSLNASETLGFPPRQWSWHWYGVLLADPSWRNALLLSLKVAAGATVLAVLTGTAAALAIVRHTPKAGHVLYGLAVAPLIVPGIVLSLGLLILFARLGWLGSVAALILAHAVPGVSYVVVVTVAALRTLDQTIERAARVLGATPLRAFLFVTLPALRGAVLAGAMFAFFASFDDLLITLFVGSGLETFPVRIWNDLNLRLDPSVAAAACLMVALSIAGLGLAEFGRRYSLQRSGT